MMKYAIMIQLYHEMQISKTDREWKLIRTDNHIEYKWRLTPKCYQLIAGVYDEVDSASNDANRLYVSLFYSRYHSKINQVFPGYFGRLINEQYYDYAFNDSSIHLSNNIAIFETDSLSNIENCPFSGIRIKSCEKYEQYFDYKHLFSNDYFLYSEDSHHCLYVMNLAFNTHDFGFRMNLLCGLLEKLSIDGEKDSSVTSEIDRLISLIDKSKLSTSDYDQLKNYLLSGKHKSARQKCLSTINTYANGFSINGYSAKEILTKAYSVRSDYSHGKSTIIQEPACFMNELMLHIVNEYYKDKQQQK